MPEGEMYIIRELLPFAFFYSDHGKEVTGIR